MERPKQIPRHEKTRTHEEARRAKRVSHLGGHCLDIVDEINGALDLHTQPLTSFEHYLGRRVMERAMTATQAYDELGKTTGNDPSPSRH